MRVRPVFVVALVGLAVVALWLAGRRQLRAPTAIPAPTPAKTATVSSPPTPTEVPVSPTPEPTVQRHTTVVLPWGPEPTPSPTAEPTERPGTPPTPAVNECVGLRYSTGVLPGTLGRILVEVRLENRCARDLGPLEVWFWVGGFRQGALVQSVRGHPLDPIARGHEGRASIVLPGSIDWYDRIVVQLIAPGVP